MKKNLYFLLILFYGFFVSCKKYLEKPPTSALAYPTTIANCQALLDNSKIMNEERTPSLLAGSSDDFFVTQSQFNNLNVNTAQRIYLWDVPIYSFAAFNDWIDGYAPIYNANVCLENIDQIDRSDNVAAWNNVKGSAYFFRAYYFLQLAWTYSKAYDETTSNSDLGIAIKKTTDLYETTIRSSVKQTYDQIISDAKQSILYLPDTPNHPLRPSKVAAFGLLARAYLSMRIYDSSGLYAAKYLALKNSLIDFNGDVDLVNPYTVDVSPFRCYNKETAFYTSSNTNLSIPGIFSSYVDSFLLASYGLDDLRNQAFFTGVATYRGFKGSYSQNAQLRFTGIATDEMYLIRAECYARNGDKDNALANLNTLLVKRWKSGTFVPVTTANSEQALQIILMERRKELLIRGLRWADLKRLNKESVHAITLTRKVNGQTYTLPPNDNRYALPIPENIILQTGIPQNPR